MKAPSQRISIAATGLLSFHDARYYVFSTERRNAFVR